MSHTLRRNRLLALVAAAVMIVVICGYSARGFGGRSNDIHCDWTMHFTGVSGSAPHPAPIVKPVLATLLMPPVAAPASRSARRLRAHLARGPPLALSIS